MEFKDELAQIIKDLREKEDPLLENYEDLEIKYENLKKKRPDLPELEILWKLRVILRKKLNSLTYWGLDELAQQKQKEIDLIEKYLPEEPPADEIMDYLHSLTDVEVSYTNFRYFLDKAQEHFGTKIPAKYIIWLCQE